MSNELNVKILFGFLALLLIIFVVITVVKQSPSSDSFEYNGYTINAISNGRVTTYKTDVFINGEGPFVMNSRYSPSDVDDIFVDPDVYSYIYSKGNFSVAIDPTDTRLKGATTLAGLEFNNYIEGFYQIPVTSAVTKPHDKYPLRSCEDGEIFSGLAILELSESTQVILDNGTCIRIQGTSEEDLIRAADRLGFGLVGIIPQ